MHPELFEIPFLNVTVKSYGLMMVIGFLAAVALIRRLSRSFTPDPQLITNVALYALIGGVVGARLFFVIHYFEQFRGDAISVFAIWKGGLELLGGVLLAIAIIFAFLMYHKLPIRRYLDALAVGLMLAHVFGRIGCLLNGCCYGKPANLPWAVRFPYNSFAYRSQVSPDPPRNRLEPHLKLPDDYLVYHADGTASPKPFDELTPEQKYAVTEGPYRCLPVHPTQIYCSLNAMLTCLVLYLFRRRSLNADLADSRARFLTKPGQTFALMFILYGLARFLIELLRDDNPYEFNGLTVSQNLGIALVLLGIIFMLVFQKMKRYRMPRLK